MAEDASPTVRRRRLAAELRQLREAKGRSGESVATALRWSPSKISRYERAKTGLRPKEVERLLDYYGVGGARREMLLALAAVAIAFPKIFTDPAITNYGVLAMIFVTVVTAWNIFSGYCGYISLGHAVFFGTGAYTVGIAARAWHLNGDPVFALLPLAGGVAAAVSVAAAVADMVAAEAAVVLSLLAWEGQPEEGAARTAFDAGMRALGLGGTLLPREQCSLAAFDAALRRLAGAPPEVKRRLVNACAACILADEQVTVREGELLRAVCAVLGCPMPPLLAADA